MVNVNMGIPLYDADAIGVRKDLYRLPYPFSYERWNGTKRL